MPIARLYARVDLMATTIESGLEETDYIRTINSLATLILDLPPSCVQFSPQHDDLFVIGTYLLEEPSETSTRSLSSTQGRSGSLILCRLDILKSPNPVIVATLLTQYAVLDLRFSLRQEDVFVVATSIGTVDVYRLELSASDQGSLRLLRSVRVCDSTILVLSLAFRPSTTSDEHSVDTVGFSLSDGRIGQVVYFTSAATVPHTTLLQAHSLEAWVVAWSSPTVSTTQHLYSGGDDMGLCKYRAPIIGGEENDADRIAKALNSQPVICDIKTHGAGVTAIMWVHNTDTEDILITGSYDEHLRVVMFSKGRQRAKVLAEERLHGGVWKLTSMGPGVSKDRVRRIEILASCMHAGARIVRVEAEGNEWSIRVLAKFVEHESMNYASDVRNHTAISTSFYDKKLCIWDTKDA